MLLSYTLTLASMKTGRALNGIKIFRGSAYMAWLFLSVGIALGGVWAYEVLGWGGYWAWDPVETASLHTSFSVRYSKRKVTLENSWFY